MTWRCSEKQRELILKLIEEHQLDKNQIEALAVERFGKGVRHLNKVEASGLIDELLPEATALAFDEAFAHLERDEGPVRIADQAELEKCRLDGLRVIAAYLDSPEALSRPPTGQGKEARRMKPVPMIILIALALALSACEETRKPPARRRDDAKAAEIARLKDEMERRVREARDEHLLRAARLLTIRITAFVILTGGAVTWFILIHRPARKWPADQA